jgi:NACHT domain
MISPDVYGPAIENIILGVLANGLTSIISNLGYKCKNVIISEKIKETGFNLPFIIEEAVDAARETEDGRKISKISNLSAFLASPEVETIVRQIYSARLLRCENSVYSDSIYKEFLAHFSLFTSIKESINEDGAEKLARPLFDAIVDACDKALSIAIECGILSAHEAKSSIRHQILLDEIEAIQKVLDFLFIQQKTNLQEILDFEKKYRQQVANRHGTITPPNFDKAYKIPIDQLYVIPNFIRTSKRKNEEASVLDINELLSVVHRTVLLGMPGGGKSTFSCKVSNDLATDYSKRLLAGRQVTPVLVILRDYGVEKKSHNCSILEFIETTANSKYQVKSPQRAFEYLLLNGRIAVIFDGLDELLDTSYRQEISNDIESFCLLYPSVPVIVTSREVSYEQAPLNEKLFETFGLSPFTDIQVQKYVENWFATDLELTYDQQKQRANAFLEESKIVPDLRSNPLMLALMCNIYLGENYIPNNRPDVYEKCATMLFDRWDKGRGIRVPRSVEEIQAHIRPTMMYLAYWIYSDEALQGGVTERNLIKKAGEYLNERRFEDFDEAETAAKRFIEFCRGRAWVFTDIGMTKEGENLYQFTHRTFLEYFTAAHLVRINPTPEKMREVLFPKIAKREWDVVAQLGFQIQNKNVDGAADELLSSLIENALNDETDDKWNFLSFAARCLEFIIPKPKTVRLITSEFINIWLEFGLDRLDLNIPEEQYQEGPILYTRKPEVILGFLLNCSTENRKTVRDTLVNNFIDKINKGNKEEACLILEVVANIESISRRFRKVRGIFPETLEISIDIREHVFEECSSRINQLCSKSLGLSRIVTWQGGLPIDDFINSHGFKKLFILIRSGPMYNRRYIPYADSLTNAILQYPIFPREELLQKHLYDFSKIGTLLINKPTPWIDISEADPYISFSNTMKKLPRKTKAQTLPDDFINDPNALFGAFALLGISIEKIGEENDITKNILLSGSAFVNYINIILRARVKEIDSINIVNELSKLNFTTEQQDLILKWIKKEVTFIPCQVK